MNSSRSSEPPPAQISAISFELTMLRLPPEVVCGREPSSNFALGIVGYCDHNSQIMFSAVCRSLRRLLLTNGWPRFDDTKDLTATLIDEKYSMQQPLALHVLRRLPFPTSGLRVVAPTVAALQGVLRSAAGVGRLGCEGAQVPSTSTLSSLVGSLGEEEHPFNITDLVEKCGLSGLVRLELTGMRITNFVAITVTVAIFGTSGTLGQVARCFPRLRSLGLNNSGIVGDLSSLSTLVGLTELTIDTWYYKHRDKRVTGDISSLSSLIYLKSVSFIGCKEINGDLSSFSCLRNLKTICLSGCAGLTGDLKSLSSLMSPTTISIDWCRGITGNLISLASLDNVTFFCISNCHLITIPENLPYAASDRNGALNIACVQKRECSALFLWLRQYSETLEMKNPQRQIPTRVIRLGSSRNLSEEEDGGAGANSVYVQSSGMLQGSNLH